MPTVPGMRGGATSSLRQLVRALQAAAPADAVIAYPVDHPLMLDGPDILVGCRGRGLAIFRPRRGEDMALLAARVLVSRLLLSRSTACVGLLRPGEAVEGEAFDLQLDPASPTTAADLAASLAEPSGAAWTRPSFPIGVLCEVCDESRAQHPAGGHLSTEAATSVLPLGTLVQVVDLADSAAATRAWLLAASTACRLDGMQVSATGARLPVVLVRGWNEAPEIASSLQFAVGALVVAADTPEELLAALAKVAAQHARETGA